MGSQGKNRFSKGKLAVSFINSIFHMPFYSISYASASALCLCSSWSVNFDVRKDVRLSEKTSISCWNAASGALCWSFHPKVIYWTPIVFWYVLAYHWNLLHFMSYICVCLISATSYLFKDNSTLALLIIFSHSTEKSMLCVISAQ